MMKQWRIKKLKQAIRDEAAAKYSKKITICSDHSNIPLMNNTCSFNAVHAVVAEKFVSVVACIMLEKDNVTAHYINQKANGDYIDITLGWAYSTSDYRFVSLCNAYEKCPADMLRDFKTELCDHHLTWFDKNILKIDKWDLV